MTSCCRWRAHSRHPMRWSPPALPSALARTRGKIFAALGGLKGAPGRMEKVAFSASGAPIYVDYAHTPDSLEKVLQALRPHTTNRLHVVFGCGGDRDKGKRPLMGAVAVKLADDVIVTDDNPRTEDPAAIRKEILAAAPARARSATVPRRSAPVLPRSIRRCAGAGGQRSRNRPVYKGRDAAFFRPRRGGEGSDRTGRTRGMSLWSSADAEAATPGQGQYGLFLHRPFPSTPAPSSPARCSSR